MCFVDGDRFVVVGQDIGLEAGNVFEEVQAWC